MINLDVHVTIPPGLDDLLAGIAAGMRQRAAEAGAVGVEAALRDHFADLQRRPRRDGLRSTGFWSGADGNSVAEQITGARSSGGGAAEVAIGSPELAHKLAGGTIRASDYGHPYLTIPANDEAAAAPQGARSFETRIQWVEHPDGGVRPALVAQGNYVRATRNRKTGAVSRRRTRVADRANAGAGDVLFWLVRQVTHQPMPDALPPDTALGEAALDAAQDAIDAMLQESAV